MTTYVVGDLQGCIQPLKCLLRQVKFNPDKDVLWSAGDIVNRGPKSLKTLRWFHERRDNIKMVLGKISIEPAVILMSLGFCMFGVEHLHLHLRKSKFHGLIFI